MKKFLMAAIAVLISVGASAQLISSNTVYHKKGRGYNRLSVSYKSFKIDDMTMNGVSLDWTKGISLSSSIPLYLETGVGVKYATKSEDDEFDSDYYGGYSQKYLGVTIPIDVTYKFDIGETGIKIAPFAGIYLRGNIIGKTDTESYEGELDWYEDFDCKRFNLGYLAGVGFEYKALYLGLSYGGDINEIADDTKSNTFAATLGVTF